MLNEIGAFVGDKIGAAKGKHQASRLWIKGFGRERRLIQRERERCSALGRKTGKATEIVAQVVGFFFGKFL
jgi:hypothetical protein